MQYLEVYNILFIEDLEDELDICDAKYTDIFYDESVGNAIVVLEPYQRQFFTQFRAGAFKGNYQVITEQDFLNYLL